MHLGAAVAVAVVLASGASSAAAAGATVRARAASARCHYASLAPSATDGARVANATVCLINIERARYGLAPVRTNPTLARIARGQSYDMVQGNYFADHSLEGLTPLERISTALYPAHVATTGQNIAWGTGADATPEGIVRAWMHSAPHRHIILTTSYREAGVGVVPSLPMVLERGSEGATYALDLTTFTEQRPPPAPALTPARTAPALARRAPAPPPSAPVLVSVEQQVSSASGVG